MEDPWANAWGDQSRSLDTTTTSTPVWTAPSVPATQSDDEDDISVPSWSTGPTTSWGDAGTKKSSTWELSEPTWDTPASPTIEAPFSETEHEETDETPSSTVDEEEAHTETRSVEAVDDTPTILPVLPDPVVIPRTTSPFVADDADGFGTFETGDDVEEDDPWAADVKYDLPSAGADAWADSWKSPTDDVEADESKDDLDDAWKAAREQKERRDRHVPPEVAAKMLRDAQTVAQDLWPESPSDKLPTKGSVSLEAESLDVAPVALKLIPHQIELAKLTPFSKTFTYKHMTEALKLTRHAPITRSSPLNIYMLSKGSVAWESAVKAKKYAGSEDFTPAGWKILDQTPQTLTPIVESKKKGGLFSFFGRQAAQSPVDPPRSASPVHISSPRPSIDTTKSTHTARNSVSSLTPATPALIPSTSSISTATISTATSDISLASAPTASLSPSDVFPLPPTPPSAVSRFFGRFRSANPTKESLALSSDDLEFLSDMPTPTTKSDTPMHFDALESFVRPVTTTKPSLPPPLPPPLAPPPKLSSRAPSRTISQPANQDLFSLFNEPSEPVSAESQAGPFSSSIPPLAPPKPIGSFTPPVSRPPSRASQTHSRTPSSAATTSTFTPPPKLLPPPTSSLSRTSSLAASSPFSSGMIPSLPPPPGSRSQTPFAPVSLQTIPQKAHMKEDDEFSDFLSSPPPAPTPKQPAFSAFPYTPPKPQAAASQSFSAFEDFDDFLGSPDPVPPAPPAKSGPPFKASSHSQVKSSPPPPINAISKAIPPLPIQTSHTRRVSDAEHSRTSSLLENASRTKWLNPPSPLPEPIPPPTRSTGLPFTTGGLGDFDLFGGSSAPSNKSQDASSRSSSPWALPPPPGRPGSSAGASLQPSPMAGFKLSQPPASANTKSARAVIPAPIQVKAVPSTQKSAGGLSAQDLSFFEGL